MVRQELVGDVILLSIQSQKILTDRCLSAMVEVLLSIKNKTLITRNGLHSCIHKFYFGLKNPLSLVFSLSGDFLLIDSTEFGSIKPANL